MSNSWYPEGWSEDSVWMRIFRNARISYRIFIPFIRKMLK